MSRRKWYTECREWFTTNTRNSMNWKIIEGTHYEVSDHGHIRRFKQSQWSKNTILKPTDNWHGYKSVMLSHSQKTNRVYIHRIVALSFLPNPENKPQVNHKNWIKSDNRLENLEWVTGLENVNHAQFTLKSSFWPKNPKTKRVAQFSIDGEFIKEYDSLTVAWKETWLFPQSIWHCASGKSKHTWWYIFRFIKAQKRKKTWQSEKKKYNALTPE